MRKHQENDTHVKDDITIQKEVDTIRDSLNTVLHGVIRAELETIEESLYQVQRQVMSQQLAFEEYIRSNGNSGVQQNRVNDGYVKKDGRTNVRKYVVTWLEHSRESNRR